MSRTFNLQNGTLVTIPTPGDPANIQLVTGAIEKMATIPGEAKGNSNEIHNDYTNTIVNDSELYGSVFGRSNKVNAEGGLACGKYNKTDKSYLFTVGNGTSDAARSNIIAATNDTVYLNGKVNLQKLSLNDAAEISLDNIVTTTKPIGDNYNPYAMFVASETGNKKVITASNITLGSLGKPIYLKDGKFTECNDLSILSGSTEDVEYIKTVDNLIPTTENKNIINTYFQFFAIPSDFYGRNADGKCAWNQRIMSDSVYYSYEDYLAKTQATEGRISSAYSTLNPILQDLTGKEATIIPGNLYHYMEKEIPIPKGKTKCLATFSSYSSLGDCQEITTIISCDDIIAAEKKRLENAGYTETEYSGPSFYIGSPNQMAFVASTPNGHRLWMPYRGRVDKCFKYKDNVLKAGSDKKQWFLSLRIGEPLCAWGGATESFDESSVTINDLKKFGIYIPEGSTKTPQQLLPRQFNQMLVKIIWL